MLQEDFQLHALPDACVNILFNQLDTEIAGVTALPTTYEILNLGKSFLYAGIQLLPGVWQGNPQEIFDRFAGLPKFANCRDYQNFQGLSPQPPKLEIVNINYRL